MNIRITLGFFILIIGLVIAFSNSFAAVPTISHSPSTNVYTINTAITTLSPTVTNSPISYAITSGTLPAGLAFSTSTGKITGTPTAVYATATITVKATNLSGTSTGFVITFTVNPTAPTGTGDLVCSSGTATLSALGRLPTGGTYTWRTALSGGTSLGTGTTFTTPSLSPTTTYYVEYTKSGTTSTPRTAVAATVNSAPVIATATTTGAYFSYPFTAGSSTDATGGGNNGTLQRSPATTADRFGAANNAYSFDGVNDLNGTITYSKIVTLMYANPNIVTKNTISLYPNPAKGMLNLDIIRAFNTASAASVAPDIVYNIKIVNTLGSVVKTATTNQQNWRTDVSSLVAGNYVIQVVNNSDSSIVGKGTFIKL